MNVCQTCKKPFDNAHHRNCGGDCLTCMAEAGDPDCKKSLEEMNDLTDDELTDVSEFAAQKRAAAGEGK